MSGRTFVDVSHVVENGLVTYRGLPAPVVCDYMSRANSRGHYAEGTEFQIGRIEMVANTGTYVDSPFHRYEGGKDLADLPLPSLADLECVVVRAPARRRIDADAFAGVDVRGRAVLVHTGWESVAAAAALALVGWPWGDGARTEASMPHRQDRLLRRPGPA